MLPAGEAENVAILVNRFAGRPAAEQFLDHSEEKKSDHMLTRCYVLTPHHGLEELLRRDRSPAILQKC